MTSKRRRFLARTFLLLCDLPHPSGEERLVLDVLERVLVDPATSPVPFAALAPASPSTPARPRPPSV